jgi:hypothetical protein
MNKYRTIWASTALLTVLASCTLEAAAGPDSNDPTKSVPPEVIKKWRDAGAAVGWMKDSSPKSTSYGFWRPWRENAEAGAIPAFRFPERNARGVLDKLPNPGIPFGLDFHCGFFAGATLKDLAGLKNLQSLCIGGVQGKAYADLKDLAGMTSLRGLYLFYLPVDDAQLKHLAAMKDLQALDLSHTRVTDSGLKELAGLKNLRWLNLHGTKVTTTGLAALEKELPKCNITIKAPDRGEGEQREHSGLLR